MAIRIFVAESHFLSRSGLVSILSRYDSIEIVGLATTREELMTEIILNPPEILLLDSDLVCDGTGQIIRSIHQAITGIKILLLVTSAKNPVIMVAFHAGVLGCILRDSSEAELISSVKYLYDGKAPISPEVTTELLSHLTRREPLPEYSNNKNIPLTHREFAVLQLVTEGLPNKMIADRLEISERTVEAHVRNILKKMNATSRTQAAIFATQNGWWS